MRDNRAWGRPVAEQPDLCTPETISLTRNGGWLELASASENEVSYASDVAALRDRLEHVDALERAYLEGEPLDPQYAADGDRWSIARSAETMRATTDGRVRELLTRGIRDQVTRVVGFGEAAAPFTEGLSETAKRHWPTIVGSRMAEVDCDNTAWLRQEIGEHGWFDLSRYGAEADNAAWLIVQHADRTPAFQGEMLALIEERAAAGESDPEHMAYLWDRVAVKEGRPQRYGTQIECANGETQAIGGIEDVEHVEERRAAFTMMTYALYLQMMDRMYDGCPP